VLRQFLIPQLLRSLAKGVALRFLLGGLLSLRSSPLLVPVPSSLHPEHWQQLEADLGVISKREVFDSGIARIELVLLQTFAGGQPPSAPRGCLCLLLHLPAAQLQRHGLEAIAPAGDARVLLQQLAGGYSPSAPRC